ASAVLRPHNALVLESSKDRQQRKAGSISESRRREETGQICRHGPRLHRRQFPLRSDVLPSTASNGQSGSANCSLKANQSAKSVCSPVSRISRKFIGGWTRTATFATNTRARARSRPTNTFRRSLRLQTPQRRKP